MRISTLWLTVYSSFLVNSPSPETPTEGSFRASWSPSGENKYPWLTVYSHLLVNSPSLLSLFSPSSLARDPRRGLL